MQQISFINFRITPIYDRSRFEKIQFYKNHAGRFSLEMRRRSSSRISRLNSFPTLDLGSMSRTRKHRAFPFSLRLEYS